MCAYVRACVRACIRACMRAGVCVCAVFCAGMSACACMPLVSKWHLLGCVYTSIIRLDRPLMYEIISECNHVLDEYIFTVQTTTLRPSSKTRGERTNPADTFYRNFCHSTSQIRSCDLEGNCLI